MPQSDPSPPIDALDWSRTPLGAPETWPATLRAMFDLCLRSPFPVAVYWGPELRMLYNAPYAARILRSRHPAALGRPAREVWGDIWPVIEPVFRAVVETGAARLQRNAPFSLERGDGVVEERYFTFAFAPVVEDGRTAGVFASVLETTAPVNARRRVSRRLARMTEADRAKTAFFNNISHEFRTPLTLMLGPLGDLLARPGLGEDVRGELRLVERNARRLMRLVDTLLEFGRIDARRRSLRRVAVDVAGLTADLTGMFRAAYRASGLTVTLEAEPLDAPAMLDVGLYEHLVMNLLANALKYTFAGGARVSVGPVDGAIRLRVADTGVGMDEADAARAFERFYRGRAPRARTAEGSGIGLALVDEIARLHGGSARLESRPGAGTVVTVDLPFLRAEAAARDADATPAGATTALAAVDGAPPWGGAVEPVGGQAADRPLILLIEDNADMRAYLGRLLADRYRVAFAVDGVEGVAAAARLGPSLILSDVAMPRGDGVALVRRLRRLPETRRIPIVFLTAGADGPADEAYVTGADGCIAKPFASTELLARVERELLYASARADELARFRAVSDHLPHIVYMHDVFGNVDWANRRWYALTGLPPELALSPAGWSAVVAPEDAPAVTAAIRRAILEKTGYRVETRIKAFRAEAEAYRWYAIAAEPMWNGQGACVGWAGTATDIDADRRQALESERVHQREHRASNAFQMAALPKELPRLAWVDFSAVYQAAEAGALVGGDWYDAFRLEDGRLVLSVGDVNGSGLEASVTMAAVRQSIRGAVQIYPDPVAVLDAADRALRSEQPDRIVTAFVGILDPVTLVLTYASAGHPPPLLLDAPGDFTDLAAGGLPLGVRDLRDADPERSRAALLPERSLLVLYTDGLIEATRDVIEGDRRLRAAMREAVAANEGPSVAERIRDAVAAGAADDVAILAVAIGDAESAFSTTGRLSGGGSRWRFASSDGERAAQVRREIVGALRGAGAADRALPDVELVYSELVGNVVRHTPGEVEVVLDVSGAAPVLHVLDRGPGFTFHARLPKDVMSESGRGLYIASRIAHDVSVTPRHDGGSHARVVLATPAAG